MENFPKSARDSLARKQGADMHPDADLLTAFGEGSTTERERQTVLAHLAVCAQCREVVSLALPEFAPQTVVAPERKGWARRWMWVPALGAVAIVAISASLLLDREQVNREQKTPATETAGVARQQKSVEEPPRSPDQLAPSAEMAKTAPIKAAKDSKRDKTRDEKDVVASSQITTAETQSKSASGDLFAKRTETDQQESARAFHGTTPQPQHPEVGMAQQTVEVTSAAPLVDVNPANAPAAMPAQPARKAAASDYRAMGRVVGGTSNSEALSGPLAQNQNTQNQGAANNVANKVSANAAPRERAKKETAAMPAPPVPSTAGYTDVTTSKVDASTMRANWRIDADGRLLRSIGASSFTPVISDKQTVFRAVSVNGTDIWVGGNAGALYHSTDNGVRWTRVDVLDEGKKVTANIIGVRFQDAQRGVITTESGKSWTTEDGGTTWVKGAIR